MVNCVPEHVSAEILVLAGLLRRNGTTAITRISVRLNSFQIHVTPVKALSENTESRLREFEFRDESAGHLLDLREELERLG